MTDFPTDSRGQATLRLADGKPTQPLTKRERQHIAYLKWSQSERGRRTIKRNSDKRTNDGISATRARAYRTKLRAHLHELKSSPCADCGRRFDPVCMDFDHRPGEAKLFGIGKSLHVKREDLLAEIAKCDLVCANCHRIRTFRNRDHASISRGRK